MEVRPNGSSIFIIQRLFTKSEFKSRAQHDCVPESYVISHTVPDPACVISHTVPDPACVQ